MRKTYNDWGVNMRVEFAGVARAGVRSVSDMPLVICMVILSLTMGLVSGMSAGQLVETFNIGFGRALGEFALILLPSFVLAAAMARDQSNPGTGVAAVMSPIAGAWMICPDTAYAALSPIAGSQKMTVAFGSYAGFKLLYPAGPLIVATGLGGGDAQLALYGAVLLLPVFLVSVIWVKMTLPAPVVGAVASVQNLPAVRPLFPFLVLAVLLAIGAMTDGSAWPVFEFLTLPKGALWVAAVVALADVPGAERRDCMDRSVRRTGSLLLVIGAASVFGAMVTRLIPMDDVFPTGTGTMAIIGLFALSAMFKLAQGSSMASFAAIAPVAAPIVAGLHMSQTAAVFAICLGSFVAILPNDSFYWLVRRDALADVDRDEWAIFILAGGATLQAVTGLIIVIVLVRLGFM